MIPMDSSKHQISNFILLPVVPAQLNTCKACGQLSCVRNAEKSRLQTLPRFAVRHACGCWILPGSSWKLKFNIRSLPLSALDHVLHIDHIVGPSVEELEREAADPTGGR